MFFDTNAAAPQKSGLFTASVRSNGAYTAKLQQAGKAYSLAGQFSASGCASNQITILATSRQVVLLQFDLAGGQTVSGVVSNAAWTAELVANRTGLWTNGGQYTLVIPGSDDDAEPGGNGFGTLTVSKTGGVTFSGVLGDGTKVVESAALSSEGQWPLYVPLYQNQGLLIGCLNVTNAPDSDLSGL